MKSLVLILLASMVLSSCGPNRPKEPEKFGTVKSIKLVEQIDKQTGQIVLVKAIVEETAERSVVDKGADSLMAPQKVASFNQYFSSYNLGQDDSIILSVYNQESGNGGSDIWIYHNGKMRLTNTSYDHFSPSFSNDSRFVYFSSYKGKKQLSQYGQDSYIWRTSSSGAGGLTRIGSPSYAYTDVSESKSGEYLLFTSYELYGSQPYIWYMRTNGALPTQLKQGYSPQWLDYETIIFTARDESTGLETIWTVKTDGSMLTQLIADENFNCKQPQPSPNGDLIAYVKENPAPHKASTSSTGVSTSKRNLIEETRDVFIYSVRDGLSQQVTTNESRDDLPKWSEDGRYLYFRSSRGLDWNIWRIDAERLVN